MVRVKGWHGWESGHVEFGVLAPFPPPPFLMDEERERIKEEEERIPRDYVQKALDDDPPPPIPPTYLPFSPSPISFSLPFAYLPTFYHRKTAHHVLRSHWPLAPWPPFHPPALTWRFCYWFSGFLV